MLPRIAPKMQRKWDPKKRGLFFRLEIFLQQKKFKTQKKQSFKDGFLDSDFFGKQTFSGKGEKFFEFSQASKFPGRKFDQTHENAFQIRADNTEKLGPKKVRTFFQAPTISEEKKFQNQKKTVF